MKLRVVIEPDEDVYVAYCQELPGCVTMVKQRKKLGKILRKLLSYI